MIPKIIHYCWFGGKELPEDAKKCLDSWKKFCPGFKIICWDESNCDFQFNDYVKEAYECKKWAFVSDVMRLKILYECGGVYLDTDVQIIKTLDPLLEYDSFWGFEDGKHVNTGLGVGAVKAHPYIKYMLEQYKTLHFKTGGTFDMTPCPHRNTDALEQFGLKRTGETQMLDNNIVLAPEYLCPLEFKTGRLKITVHTYSIHLFNNSWFSEKDKKQQAEYYKCIERYGTILGKGIFIIKNIPVSEMIWIVKEKMRR